MNHVVLTPTWVWIFDDQRNRGVQELLGEKAEAYIAQLRPEPTVESSEVQEGGVEQA